MCNIKNLYIECDNICNCKNFDKLCNNCLHNQGLEIEARNQADDWEEYEDSVLSNDEDAKLYADTLIEGESIYEDCYDLDEQPNEYFFKINKYDPNRYIKHNSNDESEKDLYLVSFFRDIEFIEDEWDFTLPMSKEVCKLFTKYLCHCFTMRDFYERDDEELFFIANDFLNAYCSFEGTLFDYMTEYLKEFDSKNRKQYDIYNMRKDIINVKYRGDCNHMHIGKVSEAFVRNIDEPTIYFTESEYKMTVSFELYDNYESDKENELSSVLKDIEIEYVDSTKINERCINSTWYVLEVK